MVIFAKGLKPKQNIYDIIGSLARKRKIYARQNENLFSFFLACFSSSSLAHQL